MRRAHRSRIALTLFVLAPGLAAAPAHAVWGPDSVLTVGSTYTHPLHWISLVPAGGPDFYVVWQWYYSAGVSRVTTEGSLVFSNDDGLSSGFSIPGVAADGSGGLIAAWSLSDPTNSDIALRRVLGDGTFQPGPYTNYWAAQTPVSDLLPAVATDLAGGAYIGWFMYDRYALQRVTTAGTIATGWPALGVQFRPGQLYSYSGPALLPDGSGGTYMLFQNDCARVVRVTSDAKLAPGWYADGVALESSSGYGTGSASELWLVSSSAERTFAVWTESGGDAGKRIMVQRFEATGDVDGGELALTPFMPGISWILAQSDGQSGLLVSWNQSGAFEVAHVLADGTEAAGPFAASPGGAVAPSRDGGFIVFGADAAGIQATWYLANGSLDPSEPVNPRLVHPRDPSGPPELSAVIARSDGDGGALLVLSEGGPAYYTELLMRHVFRTGALGVGDPPRPARLAFSLAPNPARSELTLDLSLAADGPASIELMDVSGRRLLARAIEGGPRARRERLALPAGIAPGVYLARVTQGTDARVRRFTVLN